MRGLADDAPGAAPAVDGSIGEVAEHARGLAGHHALALGLGERLFEHRLQVAIARQTKHVVDAVRLAPPRQRGVGKAAVGTQDDAHPRPLLTDLRDNARHLLDGAVAARDVRTPLPGQQQVPAAEHVERQIAVFVVDPMGRDVERDRRSGRVRLLTHPLRRRSCKLQLSDPKRRPLLSTGTEVSAEVGG